MVISAPSGSGKTTVCKRLLQQRPDWEFSVSATTRPRRASERDGVDYWFLSLENFRHRLVAGDFVESEEVHGDLYATPRKPLESALRSGRTLLLEVDVKGGIAIRSAFPSETLTIFLRPPSVEELVRRLKRRGSESEERIRKRLERVEMEMDYEKQFQHSVINGDLETTVAALLGIIEGGPSTTQQRRA